MIAFRRDKLRRLVEAGRVEMCDGYHYDEMTGESRTQDAALPVAIREPGNDWRLLRQGVCYLFPSDFRSKSGCCYESGENRVTLHVHSNCNYTFRILAEGRTE